MEVHAVAYVRSAQACLVVHLAFPVRETEVRLAWVAFPMKLVEHIVMQQSGAQAVVRPLTAVALQEV